jgi:DNA topoisomerase-1
MNQREAKIVALGIAHRILDAASPAEVLEETGVTYHQDDIAKIGAELAAISRRLEERYDELLRTGRSFTSPFEKPLPAATDEVCPECGGQVVVRHGKYGRFRGCSEYPGCKWKAPLIVGRCPVCTGDLVERVGKRGVFWGCSNYPGCKYTREPKAEKPG